MNFKDCLKNKNLNYFIGTVVFLVLYLIIFTHSFDTKYLIHSMDGEEKYYLEELPKLIAKENTTLGSPFLRFGTATLATTISGATGLDRFDSIIYLNIIVYFLTVLFLFWTAIPRFIKHIKSKDSPISRMLLTLIVMTNPVMTKYTFSIHPDIILLCLFLVVCYSMMVKKGFTKVFWITAICSLTLIFKENIIPLTPFLFVYFLDDEKIKKQAVKHAISFGAVLFTIYWFIFIHLDSIYKVFMTNRSLAKYVAFQQQVSYGIFNVVHNVGLKLFLEIYTFKLAMVYNVLWLFMIPAFIKIQKNKKPLDWIMNWFYALVGIGVFTVAATSAGIGEKYFLFYSMLPFFYLFFIRNNTHIDLAKNRKYVYAVIIGNIASLFLYFLLATKFY